MEESSSGVSNTRFAALVCMWYLCTLASNMSGKTYVKSSLDAMSPTTVSMGCAAIVYCVKKLAFRQGDSFQPGSLQQSVLSMGLKSGESQWWAFHTWAIGLGVIQFLATALSYSSFALSSVTWTYCFRTLEPLISVLLQFFAAGELTSRKELGALLVLASGIVTTVTTGSGGQTYAVWLGGLALCATVIYSCRSVIGSRVMGWYKCSGPEMFLLASTYGFGFSIWLQLSIRLLGGAGEGTLDMVMVRHLFIAGIFHCVYNLMSFQILRILQPVAHGVCNTMKRVFMVVVSALMSGHMLSGLQLIGVIVANLGAGVYGFESKKRREREKNKSHSNLTVLDGLEETGLLKDSLENGSAPIRIANGSNGHARNMGSKNESKFTVRLVGFGCMAVVIGMGFLVVSLRALHMQSIGPINALLPGKEAVPITSTVERAKDIMTGVRHTAEPKEILKTKELVKNENSRRMQCFTDVKQVIMGKFRPIFQQFPKPVMFVDVASHSYGHGSMLLGAIRLTEMHGKHVETFCSLPDAELQDSDVPSFLNCDELSNVLDESSLVMFGSGNVWGDHNTNAQSQRLEFLSTLNATQNGLKRPVVQLPNTLSYQGADVSDKELITLSHLENFHIFIRDKMGVELGKGILPKNVAIEQCPDVSFLLGPLVPDHEPNHDVLILIQEMDLGSEMERKLSARLSPRNLTWDSVHWSNRIEVPKSGKIVPQSYAEKCMQADIKLLSRGVIIITDDMKAAIMSTLLGKAHVVIESNDKSISAAFDALTSTSSYCDPEYLQHTRASSLDEALEMSVEITKGSRQGHR